MIIYIYACFYPKDTIQTKRIVLAYNVTKSLQVLCFVEIMSQQITSSEEKIQFVDISQSASRLPTSTKGSKAMEVLFHRILN